MATDACPLPRDRRLGGNPARPRNPDWVNADEQWESRAPGNSRMRCGAATCVCIARCWMRATIRWNNSSIRHLTRSMASALHIHAYTIISTYATIIQAIYIHVCIGTWPTIIIRNPFNSYTRQLGAQQFGVLESVAIECVIQCVYIGVRL